MTAFFPVSRCHCPAMSSTAFFRLAAANTTTSLPCATAGKAPAIDANPAATRRASQERLVVIAASNFAIFCRTYRPQHSGILGRFNRRRHANCDDPLDLVGHFDLAP